MLWFDVGGGFGMVEAGGVHYGVHHSEIAMDGFKWLVPKQIVTFELDENGKNGPTARNIRLDDASSQSKTAFYSSNGPILLDTHVREDRHGRKQSEAVANLFANAEGAIMMLDTDAKSPVRAHVEVRGRFRAYRTGTILMHHARVRYSDRMDRERGGLFVLDQQKVLRNAVAPGTTCDNVAPKSTLMRIRSDGGVRLVRISWRSQPGAVLARKDLAENFIVLELIFEHRFDLDRACEVGYLEREIAEHGPIGHFHHFAQSIRDALALRDVATETFKREASSEQ